MKIYDMTVTSAHDVEEKLALVRVLALVLLLLAEGQTDRCADAQTDEPPSIFKLNRRSHMSLQEL